MSPRKEQVDWRIGIKQCPCGQANHLHETHCVRCGAGFAGARSRQPFRMRRPVQIRAPDNTGRLPDLLPVQPNNLPTAVHCPRQDTTAYLETVANRLLALTSDFDWRNIKLSKEVSAVDFIHNLEPEPRNWHSSSPTATLRKTRPTQRPTRTKPKSTAAKSRPPVRLRHLSPPPPGSPSARCWSSTFSWATFAQDPE